MDIQYYAISHPGWRRKENQDCLCLQNEVLRPTAVEQRCGGILQDPHPIFAVFDGMGGASCGAQASCLAAQTMCRLQQNDPMIDLTVLCRAMNQSVCDYMQRNDVKSMGTTAALLTFAENTASVCNVGDSRIYHLVEDGMEQLSVDHTMNVGADPSRRVLTQHLGIPPEECLIEPHRRVISVRRADTFLLCTDGLTDMVGTDRIAQIAQTSDFDRLSVDLLNEALQNGGRDNVSIIVCRVQ